MGMRSIGKMVGLLALFLQACAVPGPTGPVELRGNVAFGSARRVQATFQEVGTAATVSLIDPATSRTIATTLTQPDRTFSLTIPGFTPHVKTYILEAVKGLSSNVAGHDAARLRTLVRWDGNGWQALTTGDASIGLSTTALSAIVGLRSFYTPVVPDGLIGKLTLGTPDALVEAGTGVSQAEFAAVTILVAKALQDDRDPLEALTFDGTTYRLKSLTTPATSPFISRLMPNPASAGSDIGVYGGNFHATPGDNVVTLNGLSVTVLSGDTTALLVRLPAAAASGVLELKYAKGTATASMVITPTVEGGVLPSSTSVLIPNAPGTDIPGSVFGR